MLITKAFYYFSKKIISFLILRSPIRSRDRSRDRSRGRRRVSRRDVSYKSLTKIIYSFFFFFFLKKS